MSDQERKRIYLVAGSKGQNPVFWMNLFPASIWFRSRICWHIIKRIKKNGSTILLITHREEVAAIADQASFLCGGKTVITGPPARIVE